MTRRHSSSGSFQVALCLWLGILTGWAEPPHWAYQPLRAPSPPVTVSAAPGHPVDAFIQARLAGSGLQPAPEADPRTLLRRLSFDLIGLPPTPEEMEQFERECAEEAKLKTTKSGKQEDRPGTEDPVFKPSQANTAYARAVDRLLASPRYGERWARHWMDAAHFAETHGHDQDRIRTNAWPYRDWLIHAFNADKPYARFVQEQVAGDVLFPDDPQATVALGFVAAGPWDESSLRDIREDTLDRQIGRYLDRDDMVSTVMSVFASTTVHCARCHDHKFDPIPTRDYYALQAVFAGVERANRTFDEDPAVHRHRQELLHRRRQLNRGDTNLLFAPATRTEVAAWHARHLAEPVHWQTVAAHTFVSAGGADLARQADGSLLAGGKRPDRDTYTITAPAPESAVTAVQLELLPDESLPQRGPGRQPQNGNLHLTEFQLLLFEPGTNAPLRLALVNPTADFNQDGWTIAHALDGNEKTAWGIHPQEGRAHRAVFELREPLRAPAGATLAFVLQQLHGEGHLVGRFRLSFTSAQGPVRVLPAEIAELAGRPTEELPAAQWVKLASFALHEGISAELAKLPAPSMVYAAASDFVPDGSLKPSLYPRPVHVLRRGEITQPQEEVGPGALTCLGGLPARFKIPANAEEGARRAALAQWLTARDNPLTWRSIVNRVWHHHFGRGLVDTPNDFGRMGSAPSHPELLDWLAVWFRDEAKGSFKALHRLLVTSATYRQGSVAADIRRLTLPEARGMVGRSESESSGQSALAHRPTFPPAHLQPGGVSQSLLTSAATADPDNRLFARMNRTRLDAECVRDAMLQISGRLDLRMGGPGDLQFDLQPGIHVTPRVDYAKFDVDSAAGRRRSVYRFLFRTLPDPFMNALDCPAGDQLTATRNNSVTVQQALALWNNAFAVRQAEHLAARLEAEATSVEAQLQRAFELALGRPATVGELADFTAHARQHGLANCCRLLFNSNEFVFVN